MNGKENRKFVKKKKEESLSQTELELRDGSKFWCNRSGCWLTSAQCVARQHRQEEGCVRCAQGNTVKEIMGIEVVKHGRRDIEL